MKYVAGPELMKFSVLPEYSREMLPRESSMQRPERSAKELLHFLLFIKIFFLITGITFVTIALFGEDQIRLAPYRDRQVLTAVPSSPRTSTLFP